MKYVVISGYLKIIFIFKCFMVGGRGGVGYFFIFLCKRLYGKSIELIIFLNEGF